MNTRYIQTKSSSGITLVPIESRFLSQRKIFLEGEVNGESANRFLKEVLYLNSEDSEAPIDLLLNSPGGEVRAGLQIYDCIQGSSAPIRIFCVGQACSMAALLLACGRHGRRYLLPHAEVMIHEPRLQGNLGGSASSLRSISENMADTRRKMELLLSRHTGKTVEEIAAATAYDHFMTPEEAVAFGLGDEVVGFERLVR